MKTQTTVTEFANKPLLVIHEVTDEGVEEKSAIQFGIKKAEAILASIDDIKKFVEEHQTKKKKK